MSYFTDNMAEVDSFLASLNYQLPISGDSESIQNFPEVHGSVVSTDFTPMTSTSAFQITESIDSPLETNMQFEEICNWVFDFEEKTTDNISKTAVNSKAAKLSKSLSIETAWSPSSSSEPESETPSNISPISLPLSSHRTSFSSEQSKKELQKLNRIERRREKNRNSQRNFRKRKEQYVRDLEKQHADLQKRYDALLLIFCGKQSTTTTTEAKVVESIEEEESWELPDIIDPTL